MMETKAESVLVIGAGVGGIQASLELAEAGIKVYLCDRSSSIGGSLIQMDKWFPNNHCGMCQMLPVLSRDDASQSCLRRGLVHPNIKLLPLTEVNEVSGEAGNFSITLSSKPSGVNSELCTGCGLCSKNCPIETKSKFDEGLGTHKAIYMPNPYSNPNSYTIDWASCTKCGACVETCQVKAIDLSSAERSSQLEVGAIILATGFEEFDPRPATQYGYKRFSNVITSIELERLLSPGGPTGGQLIRPSDSQIPANVAFLQCIGSRDNQRNYCSSACCMYSIKETTLIKEKYPQIDTNVYFMDLRAFGKDYYRYYEQAEKTGVKFIRCRVPVIKEDPESKSLILSTLGQDETPVKKQFDLVVLSVGQSPASEFHKVCQVLGVETNKWGFCQAKPFSPVKTTREGIYVCGSAAAPKDINDTLIEAKAAAYQASKLVSRRPATPITLNKPLEQHPEEIKLGFILCNCGGELASALNVREMTDFCRGLPDIAAIDEVSYVCHKESWAQIKETINKYGLNRLVIGACNLAKAVETDLNSSLIHVVDLRNDLALVHQHNRLGTTEKAKRLLAMAREMAKSTELSKPSSTAVRHEALILGGGLAGLRVSLSIAHFGLEVHLVEKSAELGGHLKHIYSTIEDGDTRALMENLKTQIKDNQFIHLHLETEILQAKGYAGDFEVDLKEKDSSIYKIKPGAIVVATGAQEGLPEEYLYGKSQQVISQSELERRLVSGGIDLKGIKSIAMLQCVGSRESKHPYCSRVCCSQSLKNALTLKRLNPDIDIFILYRDIMSYGFKEEFYTEARNKGVIFIRYEAEKKPEVKQEGERLVVEAAETVLGGTLVLKPDLLILSPGIVPPNNALLARILGVDLTEDGFFKEAEAKFRPLDFLREGIFVCGLAHSPRGIRESIAQADAVAQRIVSLLASDRLVSGSIVSEIVQRQCSRCELCIKACVYNARVNDYESDQVLVRETLCRGCGACVVACPSGAARLKGFKDETVFSVLDAAI
jgi:heterodisulfide reductase subunit A2